MFLNRSRKSRKTLANSKRCCSVRLSVCLSSSAPQEDKRLLTEERDTGGKLSCHELSLLQELI